MSLKGPFVIVSGPSGVGKTLFIEKSLKEFPQFSNTVSWTTRPPREGEREGEFYHFSAKDKFNQMKDRGEFLEWAETHNEFYGTSKKEVERLWKEKKGIIKDLDVKGCLSIKKIFPHSVSVFIYPPSIDELRNRLLKRGAETEESLKKRLSISAREMAQGREYDHKIVNDSFEEAWREFKDILKQSLHLNPL